MTDDLDSVVFEALRRPAPKFLDETDHALWVTFEERSLRKTLDRLAAAGYIIVSSDRIDTLRAIVTDLAASTAYTAHPRSLIGRAREAGRRIRGDTMSEHLPGRPVNSTTYQKYRCRCDGCRTAATAQTTRSRVLHGDLYDSQRVVMLAQAAAATWVRVHHPDVWAEMRAAAKDTLRAKRRAS